MLVHPGGEITNFQVSYIQRYNYYLQLLTLIHVNITTWPHLPVKLFANEG